MTMTRRELAKGAVAALVAAPVLAGRGATTEALPLNGRLAASGFTITMMFGDDGHGVGLIRRQGETDVGLQARASVVMARPDPPATGEWVWNPDHGGAWVPA